MAVKYRRADHRAAQIHRQGLFLGRLSQRQRLLLIYAGILTFCALMFLLHQFGEVVRKQEAQPLRGAARIVAVTGPEEARTLELEWPNGMGGTVRASAPAEAAEAAGLAPGDWVAVLYARSAGGAITLLEHGLVALPPPNN